MRKTKAYLLSTRPQFLTASAVPVCLGASVAWRVSSSFDPLLFAVTVLAAAACHASMNVLNDYYDFLNGTDNLNSGALTPFTGGSRFIQNGLMTPKETLALGCGLLALGCLAGLYLAFKSSPLLLLIGSFGLASGYFYSAPPVFLAGRGLGELTVGLDFGVLAVLGSYMVQTGGLSGQALIQSLPVGFTIMALLFINQFPDYEADLKAGKKNLVVLIGPERARWGLLLMAGLAYASLIAGAALGWTHALTLVSLFSVFFAAPGVSGLLKNFDRGPALIPAIKSTILAHLSTGALLILSNIF